MTYDERAHKKAKREAQKAAGLCASVGCKQKPLKDRTRCEWHLEANRLAVQQHRERQRALAQYRWYAGLDR